MNTHSSTRRGRRLHPFGSITVVACGALLVGSLQGTTTASAEEASSGMRQLSSDWERYVLGEDADIQTGLRIKSRSGSVTNAQALVGGEGAATMTTTDSANPATIIIDWGIEHGGRFSLDVSSVTPATDQAAALKVTTSETEFGLYRASTLAVQAGAGDTVVKVGSVTGFEVGRPIFIGDVRTVVTSVGTAGASGTGIGIEQPLGKSYYSGTPVTAGSPSQVVGDSGGFGITSTQTVSVSQPGVVTPSNLYGGFRYQVIQLMNPGTITIKSNTLDFAGYAAGADDYAGHFLSSDETLNRAWYSGVYTNAVTMADASVTGKSVDVMFDGAKRDRGVWSGDVVIQGPVAHQAFGNAANSYFKGSVQDLFASQRADGKVPGTTWLPFLQFYSDSYSNYSAMAAIDYYRYTGDTSFATDYKAKIEAAVAYQATKMNDRGLVQVTADPDYWQTPLSGEVSEYNAVYYELLHKAAWFEKQVGDETKAAEYVADAAALKAAMQTHLWNDDLGAYPLSSDTAANRATVATDANANALRLGLVPDGRTPALLALLDGAATPHGVEMTQTAGGTSKADPYGHEIEPLTNFWTTDGRLAAGDEVGGLDVARSFWGQQVDPDGPYYTGTTWEFMDRNGVILRPADSMAHGWGAGITSVLTEDVLGVEPVDAGYATWEIAPQPGDVSWAQGAVPTGAGKTIEVDWNKSATVFAVSVSAPSETAGTVSIPLPTASTPVSVNGTTIWSSGTFSPTAGITGATVVDGRLQVAVSQGGEYDFVAAPAPTATPTHTPTPAPTATATPPSPAPQKLSSRIKVFGAKGEVGHKIRLKVKVRAEGERVTGWVKARVKGSAKTVRARLRDGKAAIRLPAFRNVGVKRVVVKYLGNKRVAASKKIVQLRISD
jgi:hypothetical protein